MALISFSNLSKSFGLQVCFENITGELNPDDKVGLIGPNGTGKTTLLEILLGIEQSDEGNIKISRNARHAYLHQKPSLSADNSIFEETFKAFDNIKEIESRLSDLADLLADSSQTDEQIQELLDETANLQTEFEQLEGYDISHRAEAVLMGVGFSLEDMKKPVKILSGGEQARVELAKLLLSSPDLLFLDEPTNHLDIEGIQWLEKYLNEKFKGAYLIVSHDRYFLDRVTTKTWELTRGNLESFPGNYSNSKLIKASRYKEKLKQYKLQQKKVEKEAEFVRRFMAGQRTKEAQGRLKRLNRFLEDEAIDAPTAQREPFHLKLKATRQLGDIVLEAHDLRIGFGERVLISDLNFSVASGEVLGICGANGSGKTTLLNCFLGTHEPQDGYVKIGASVDLAVMTQQSTFENTDLSVFDYIHNLYPKFNHKEIYDLLGAFLFSGDDTEKKISVLSGGEIKRIEFIKILLKNANLLFLDEPTNHLDINSREAIENSLKNFSGSIVVISHDRYLLDKLVDRVLWIETDGYRIFDGNYSEMLEIKRKEQKYLEDKEREEKKLLREEKRLAKKTQAKNKKKVQNQSAKKKYVFKGSVAELEDRINDLQVELSVIEEELAKPETYQTFEKSTQLNEKYSAIKDELSNLEIEWLQRTKNI